MKKQPKYVGAVIGAGFGDEGKGLTTDFLVGLREPASLHQTASAASEHSGVHGWPPRAFARLMAVDLASISYRR